MTANNALILVFDGVEELEAVAPIDFLRRADISVTVAAYGSQKQITGRNGIHLVADCMFSEVSSQSFDCLILPGGPGCLKLKSDQQILDLIRAQVNQNRTTAAICAAPIILAEAGVLKSRAYTAHFTMDDQLTRRLPNASVVQDGPVVTSQGAGSAEEFALTLVARLAGEEKAQEIARSVCYRSEISQPA